MGRFGKFDNVARRLRARVDRSASRENSLDWKAAEAVDALQARVDALEVENKRLSVEKRAPVKEIASPPAKMEPPPPKYEPPPPALPSPPREVPAAHDRALSLREASQLLRVSYGTVYNHRIELGFFQVGSIWRIWPEKLREATSPAATNLPPPPASEQRPPQGGVRPRVPRDHERHQQPVMTISARRAAAELDKLLAAPRKKPRR